MNGAILVYFKSVTGMSDRHQCMHIISNQTDGVHTPKAIYFYLYSHAILFLFFLNFGKKEDTMILLLKQLLCLTVIECNCMLCTRKSRCQENVNPYNTRNAKHV